MSEWNELNEQMKAIEQQKKIRSMDEDSRNAFISMFTGPLFGCIGWGIALWLAIWVWRLLSGN